MTFEVKGQTLSQNLIYMHRSHFHSAPNSTAANSVTHSNFQKVSKMETISKTWREVKRLHLNYNMITSLYMMEPMERTIVNCFVILTLSLMAYSSWVYLPHYTLTRLVFSGVLGPATTTMAPAAVEGLGAEALLNFNTEL